MGVPPMHLQHSLHASELEATVENVRHAEWSREMMLTRRRDWFLLLMVVLPELAAAAPATQPAPRPLMRDFIGLNVHTVQFKPELYAPVCRRLRDYHPVRWDVGDDPTRQTTFPLAANKVDWNRLYGSWTKAGYDIDACLMFDDLPAAKWKDPAGNARAYGEAFASAFGPSGKLKLVSSVEIGNEPAKYTEEQYRTIFEAMAKGIRTADPKLTIATCAVMTGKPDQWSKPMSAVAGLEDLYDVLNVHSYPFAEKWPTWRRSYPEDPKIRFLKDITDLMHWRDAHAAGKQVWVTEFGYDASTKPPPTSGNFAKWVGVSDEEQARYTVRAFLILAASGVDRAYLYFFNDKDEPQLHGSSGITRNFQPKPAFYAMSHLYKRLGNYRLSQAFSQEDGGLYCYAFEQVDQPKEKVYVAWIASGKNEPAKRVTPLPPGAGTVDRVERLAMKAGNPPAVAWEQTKEGIELELGGDPVFVHVK